MIIIFRAKKCSGQSHYGSYATVEYVKGLPPICIHIFHPAPGKVEVKDQNTQTKTLEIKDQQVQTDSIAQNQGTCRKRYNNVVLMYITHSPASMDTCDYFYLQHIYEELR